MKNFHILVAFFLLVTMTLLIAISIYFFIKYRAKQNHLLPFHNANIKFKKWDIDNVL